MIDPNELQAFNEAIDRSEKKLINFFQDFKLID